MPENYNTLIIQECTDRPINDYTTHKQHIYIKHQNAHIYTITQQIHNKSHINTYIFFYLLAVIAVINFIKKKGNK